MNKFVLICFTLCIPLFGQSQKTSDFEGMSGLEIRQYILSHNPSDTVKQRIRFHNGWRRTSFVFTGISSVILIGGLSSIDKEDELAGLGYAITLIGAAIPLGIAGLFAIAARSDLNKAKQLYLKTSTSSTSYKPLLRDEEMIYDSIFKK